VQAQRLTAFTGPEECTAGKHSRATLVPDQARAAPFVPEGIKRERAAARADKAQRADAARGRS